MKTLTIFLCLAMTAIVAQGQSWNKTFGVNYGFTVPTGGMKQYIRYGNGVSLNAQFEAPSRRVAAGIDVNWGQYGHDKSIQDYTFDNGTVAPMKVVVTNYFTNIMASARLYMILDGPIRPYATLKAGYSRFTTNLGIFDPDNSDSCEPVEQNILTRDGTFAYSAGGGVRIDAALLFKKAQRGRFFIDVNSNILQGGRVDYMNEDAPAQGTSHGTATRAKEVEARFINTQTQVVHQHHVGYLYNSFVQMVDFRLGMSMSIN